MALDLFKLWGEVKITGLDAAEKGLVRVEKDAQGAAKGLDHAGGSARRLSKDLAAVANQAGLTGGAVQDRLTSVVSRVPLVGQPLARATQQMLDLGAASEKNLGGIASGAERAAQKLSALQAQAAKVRDVIATRQSDFGERLKIDFGGRIDAGFLKQFRQAENEAAKLKLLAGSLGEDAARSFAPVERAALHFSKLERDGAKALETVGGKVAAAEKDLAALETRALAAGGGVASLAGPLGLAAGAAVAVGAAGVLAGVGVFKLAQNAAAASGDLYDMSQRTNFSVETLSGLKTALENSGGTLEGFQNGLVVFQKNTEAVNQAVANHTDKNDKLAQTYKALGIDVSSNEAALRSSFTALSRVGDETQQTAIANRLFGRSAKDVLGIVKESGGDFDAYTDKLREMGLIIGTDAARNADKFNDSLHTVELQVAALERQLGERFLPTAVNTLQLTSDAFVRHQHTVGGVVEAIGGYIDQEISKISALLLAAEKLPLLVVPGGGLDLYTASLTAGAGERTGTYDAGGSVPVNPKTMRPYGAIDPSLLGGGTRRGGGGGGGRKKTDLTSLYEQLGDAEGSRRLAGVTFDVTRHKAGLAAEEAILNASLRAQTVSVADYWKARERITLSGLDSEINLLRTEKKIADETYKAKFEAAGSDKKLSAAERTLKQQQLSAQWAERNYQLEGQLTEATERRAAAMKTIPLEAAAAARELEKTMAGLKADSLEAGGDAVGAAYERITAKYREMHELARANKELFPDADKWVSGLERAEKLAANLARLGERFDLGSGYLSLETAQIQNRITDGVLGEREGRRQIYELEVNYRDVLRGILSESLAVAEARGDEAVILSIKQQIEETERLGHVVDQTRAKARGIFEGAFSHGLEELRGGLKHAAATFGLDLLDSIKREADAKLTKVLSEALFGKTDEFGSDSGLVGKILDRVGLGGVFGGGKGGKKADPAAQVSAAVERAAQQTEQGISSQVSNSSADEMGNRDWNTDRILDALRQLGETMESLRPQQQGFLRGLAGAALGGFLSGLGDGLAGKLFGDDDEGGGSAQGSNRNADGSPRLTDRNGTQVSPARRPRRVGRAHGGAVWGPGTSTSDSIEAQLSNGEFVMRAAAVRKIGLSALEYMNAAGSLPQRLASGGLAGSRPSYVPPPVLGGESRRTGAPRSGEAPVYVDVRLRPDAQGRLRSKSQVEVDVYRSSSESARRNS